MKKYVTNNVAVLIAIYLASFTALCFSAGAYADYVDRVLVIVNEDVITQSEFDYRIDTVLADIRESGKQAPPDLKKQLLEGMVRDRLQVQEANRRGIRVSERELDEAIERFAAQQKVSVDALRAELVAAGQPFNLFEQTVRDSMVISRFSDFYARSRVVVPDYEIDGFIAANKLDSDGSEYKVAHILLKNPEERAELAQQVRQEIADGLSFQQAVITYSEATDAQEGGLIGWRTAAQLPEVFVDAIKNMQVGQVSGVVTSPNGLHILKLLDLKGDRTEIIQNSVRHILISAESDIAKSQAAKKLFNIRQRIVNGEDFSELARIFSDDSVSAANGGSLGWVSPGEMVQPFEEAFKQLPIGEISEPIQTRFGVHILRVEDRQKKNITDQLIRARADNVLRRQRADREFQQWVRELLEGAYVEYIAEPA